MAIAILHNNIYGNRYAIVQQCRHVFMEHGIEKQTFVHVPQRKHPEMVFLKQSGSGTSVDAKWWLCWNDII